MLTGNFSALRKFLCTVPFSIPRLAEVCLVALLPAMEAKGQVNYFSSSFAALPSSVTLNGNATLTGGAVQLVSASTGQVGSMIVGNLSGTGVVEGFDVACDVYTGNAVNATLPADGWCFAWGNVSGNFGEEGPNNFTGLVVSFDYYVNAPEPGREITVKWNGAQIGSVLYDAYTAGATVPVHIQLRQGGLLDVSHNGNQLFNGLVLPGFTGISGPEWGFGARTGGQTAKVTLDNLYISPEPIGDELPRFYSALDGGLPTGVQVFGNAAEGPTGVSLVPAANSQVGSMVVQNLTASEPVTVFDVACDVFTGAAANPNTPADGWCVAVGEVPPAAFGEEGPADFMGLVVSFDYYINAPDTSREVTVKWNGTQIASVPYDAYIHNQTVPVHIRLRHGGLLDVWHNGNRLFNGLALPGFATFTAPRWGFGARTGGQTAKVVIESLAINPHPFIVTSTLARGTGSLQAQLDKAADESASGYSGPNQIHFDQSLNGQTLPVPSGGLYIDNHTVSIDASMLAGGITLTGNNVEPIMETNNNAVNAFLNRLTMTSGVGGICVSGILEMRDCTITQCTATGNGGAVKCADECHISATNCSFIGNAGHAGGAIYLTEGTASFDHCTFTANVANAGSAGGGIRATGGTVSLIHCTTSKNIASGTGGGISIAPAAGFKIAHSIVAGNFAASRPDIAFDGSQLAMIGTSVVGIEDTAGLSGGLPNAMGSFIGTLAAPLDPMLTNIGNYGGLTRTMRPLLSSPARDAAPSSDSTTDQRGFAILNIPDCGACEALLEPISDEELGEDLQLALQFGASTSATLTAFSSNTTLLPAVQLTPTATAGLWALDLAPAANLHGSSTITITDTVSGETVSFLLTVLPVNDAPTFAKGSDISLVMGNTSPQTLASWATAISTGPEENDQTAAFEVATNNDTLFSVLPSISPAGTLTYSLAPNALGQATVSVRLRDNGGTNHDGTDVSVEKTFTVTVKSGYVESFTSTSLQGASLYGHAFISSGKVRLTSGWDEQSAVVVAPFTGQQSVTAFDVTMDVQTTSMPVSEHDADGYSFAWGGPITGSFGEEGPAGYEGLVVSFDFFATGTETEPEVEVKWKGQSIARIAYNASINSIAPVHIRLRHGGLLDVRHNDTLLFDGLLLPDFAGMTSPAWGFGARTGGYFTNIALDNFIINPTPWIVTTGADSGTGSLRQALMETESSFAQGPNQIQFASTLDGGTISHSSPLSLGDHTVAVDASMLPSGLILNGNNTVQHMVVTTGASVLLNRLQFTNGSSSSGGIATQGQLQLQDGTFSHNTAEDEGGAIYVNGGTLTADGCTFDHNSARKGGAISAATSAAAVILTRCTFSSNSADLIGAILLSGGVNRVVHCTISGNSSSGAGGGVWIANPASLHVENTILAGNSAFSRKDIYLSSGSTLTRGGHNILGYADGSAATIFPDGKPNTHGDYVGTATSRISPLLSLLGNYGGPTQTRPLRAGSLAMNAAIGSTITADQRGYGMVGVPDIGAYEAGHDAEFSVWAAENSSTSTPLTTTSDDDGDGQNNLFEYAFRTDPRSPSSFGLLTRAADGSLSFPFRQPYDVQLRYTLEQSSDLTQWQVIADVSATSAGLSLLVAPGVSGIRNDSTNRFTFTQAASTADRQFWRVGVSAE